MSVKTIEYCPVHERSPTLRWTFFLAILPALVLTWALPSWAQTFQRNVGTSWDFTTASSTLGWTPVATLQNFGISGGALTFTATQTTYIVFGPAITVTAAPEQRVEIVMKSNTAGPAKVFWAPATSVPDPATVFSGFNGSARVDFTMVGDGAFHRYYLPIATASGSTIYRLRLDTPPGATVSIQSVALTNLVASTAPAVAPSWQFTQDGDLKGWIPYSGVIDATVSGGRLRISTFSEATILAPAAQVTNQLEWLNVTGNFQSRVERPWMQFTFKSNANSGSTDALIFVANDAADHIYNENIGGASGWYASVSHLGLRFPGNTQAAISQIQIASAPQGPADLALEALGPATPFIRAGTPFRLSLRLANRGAQVLQQPAVSLTLPSDGSVSILSAPTSPSSLARSYPQTLTWTLLARTAQNIQIGASATSTNGGSAQASVGMIVNPAVASQTDSYVPRPVPVESKYDVGINYFPGWNLDSHWDPIRNFPERMPALGYYAEGHPQVMDWQIKWAVEHGIKFFAVNWSWYSRGSPNTLGERPNPFFDGFFSAAYRNYMKFCLAYVGNQASVTATDVADMTAIAQTWVSKYFSQPEYYTINQMPVVFVVNPNQLAANFGGSARAALDTARQVARNAGFKGIYFISGPPGNAEESVKAAADGYDAVSSYSYGNVASDPNQDSYEAMIATYQQIWDRMTGASALPYIIPTGTDHSPVPWQPWYFNGNAFVRTGATPAKYKEMLLAAKARIDAGKNPPIVLADAWNEIGEGHWTEPTAGLGFGYLEAVRSVFASDSAHTDLAPTDVGLPLVQTVPATALWTFTDTRDLVAWDEAAGPPFVTHTVNLSNSRVANNAWRFTSNGAADLQRGDFNLSALDYSEIAIRMSASTDTDVQIYWGAADQPGSSALRNIGFTARAGAVQTYNLTLAGRAGWRGIINSLRLSFNGAPNTEIAIESIQFMPSAAPAALVVSKSEMLFNGTVNGAAPSAQALSVAASSPATLTWTAAANQPWVSLSNASGSGPGNVTVAVNPTGLAVGVYTAAVTVASSGVAVAKTIPVTFWVRPLASSPPTALAAGAIFSTSQASSQSFLRFHNSGTTSGSAAATLRDYLTGQILGTWTSPTIPAGAEQQFFIGAVEAGANLGAAKPAYYSLGVQANFDGYFQHVLYRPADGTLTNLSTCAANVTADPRQLSGVHTSTLGSGFPSSVVVNNTGSSAQTVTLGIYDARDGTKLGAYVTPSVPVGGQHVQTVAAIEAGARITPSSSMFHYVIKAEGAFNGFLQHLVNNTKVGVVTDMTTECSLNTGASTAATSPLRAGAVFSSAQTTSQSFLRFFNTSAGANTVTVTLRDYTSGQSFGTWTSPSIPPLSEQQFPISTIEAGANVGASKPDYYSISVGSNFAGYFQHVLYRPADGTLTNLSTCANGVGADAKVLGGVHTSTVGPGFPSSIVINNTGSSDATVTLGIYDARDGAKLGTFASAPIPAKAQAIPTVASIEAAAKIVPGGNMFHYVIKAESGFTGFLQNLVNNTKVGVVTDMTTACTLATASP